MCSCPRNRRCAIRGSHGSIRAPGRILNPRPHPGRSNPRPTAPGAFAPDTTREPFALRPSPPLRLGFPSPPAGPEAAQAERLRDGRLRRD
eukprot:6083980-Prymnesium_polylepis.1